LARVYADLDRTHESEQLQKLATRIRSNNPYHHYFLAKDYLDKGELRLARRHINKALSKHNEDSRFYALRSRTWQLDQRLSKALRDMEKAYALSLETGERLRYRNAAVRLAQAINRKNNLEDSKRLQDVQELNGPY
jgi:Tfp pilus assembly protein PilF